MYSIPTKSEPRFPYPPRHHKMIPVSCVANGYWTSRHQNHVFLWTETVEGSYIRGKCEWDVKVDWWIYFAS